MKNIKLSQHLIKNEKFFEHVRYRFPFNIDLEQGDIFDPYFDFLDKLDDKTVCSFKTFLKIYLRKCDMRFDIVDNIFDNIEVFKSDITLCLCFVYALQYYFL